MSARMIRQVEVLRRRRLLLASLAAATALATVSVPVVSSAQVSTSQLSTLKPAPDKNKTRGKTSDLGEASAKARESKKRIEVVSERTTTDSVFANPDGTFSRERAEAPIRAKTSEGKLADIDTTLTKSGSRLAPKVATGDVTFSGTGEGDLATFEIAKGASVSMRFDGELETPSTSDPSEAVYPVAGSSTEKLRAAALPDGFSTRVLLSEVPKEAPTYSFDLNLNGLSPKLENGRLLLSDSDGKIVAESRPLAMWDATRDKAGDPANTAPVDARLVKAESGSTELQLAPSMNFLGDPKTTYPVTIDPDIAKVEARGDTYYFEGQSTSDSRGSDYRLRTGEEGGATYRSLVTFAYDDFVGQTVTNATLTLHQYSSETCTAKQSDFVPTTADTNAVITWNTKPPVETSARFKASKTYNHGQSDDGCPDAFEAINVTSIVSAWAGGAINSDTTTAPALHRQGIEMRAEDENDASQEKRYCSLNLSGGGGLDCNSSSKVPVLSVTYAPELGEEPFYSMTKHSLNDRSDLSINNRTGNAFVSANDAKVNARGVPFDVTRSYNSQSALVTSLGKGWNLSLGPDVWIEKRSTYRFDYHSPDGTVFGSFVRKTADSGSSSYDNFISPLGGVAADLDQDPEDDEFILTMRDSQMKYRFTEFGSAGHAYLTQVSDRSGNDMNLAYSGSTSLGVPKLSSVTDAGGRTYAITYTGDHITSIHENGGVGRTWTFGFTGDYMTSYTDPANKVTNYTYDTAWDCCTIW